MTIKGWEDKHKDLNEQIKTYQKSLKELEDSVVLKDHNVEVRLTKFILTITCPYLWVHIYFKLISHDNVLQVLSELLADLDACDSQKDSKVVANGEVLLG